KKVWTIIIKTLVKCEKNLYKILNNPGNNFLNFHKNGKINCIGPSRITYVCPSYSLIWKMNATETKTLRKKAAKDLEERRSHYEPSLGPGIPDDVDHLFNLEENDFVPHFQRVSISGEDTSGVPLEDLQQASQLLVQALAIREKYMNNSKQSFPSITSRFLRSIDKRPISSDDEVQHDDRKAIA
ncbi:unnamed protein product, partial [Heterotrigona itama]